MGAILDHANTGSLGLYQLKQLSVVFGWTWKARGGEPYGELEKVA